MPWRCELPLMSEARDKSPETGLEIAVVGMAGRFPGADHLGEFWDNLRNGVESIAFFSDEELADSGLDPAHLESPHYVRARGVLEGIEYFDYAFFDYTPKEAQVMDPQFRLLHECVWHALEDAHCDPFTYRGAIGLYVGSLTNLYWLSQLLRTMGTASQQYEAFSLNDRDFLSTRISYKLNLRGPSFTLQTACSTSLVAIHLGCQGLLSGECDMALAGGVSILLPPRSGYTYQEGMIKSPDGHCRVFDAAARGTNGGDGVGIVALKRLKEAATDGDGIRAVIKGSALNNDGLRKVGYTAPSVEGQAEAIGAALQMAEVDPRSIGYVETHGTGTVLGDPIEIEGLKRAFNTSGRGFCALGSVKSNVGHLDAAAGVASFIKTVLALEHRLIPPSLNFETANAKIDFPHSPFYVNTGLREWAGIDGCPRRAGVSSFGIGGTNCHVILEEAPGCPPPGPPAAGHAHLLVLSAASETALERMTDRLAAYLRENHHIPLAGVAYTLQVGRRAFEYRRLLLAATTAEAVAILSSRNPEQLPTSRPEAENRPLVFMFPGQGSQYVNMGRDLYRQEPLFRRELDGCLEILSSLVGRDVGEILYPRSRPHPIDQTEIAQPLLFAFEYALARLVMNWGLKPLCLIGHSVGEYTAACLAGVFSLEEALELVVLRGKLMQQVPGGAMLGVAASPEVLRPLLTPDLSLAAVNTPQRCVVSGPAAAVAAFEEMMKGQGVETGRLHTSHAFHSAMMEPVLAEFREAVAAMRLKAPTTAYVSNLTGDWITVEQAVSADYWAQHLRSTVRFADGLSRVFSREDAVLVELGPGRTLSTLARQHRDKRVGHDVLQVVRHPRQKIADTAFLRRQLGQLWLWGIDIDWHQFQAGRTARRLRLPHYPFDRHHFSIDVSAQMDLPTAGTAAPDRYTAPGNDIEQRLVDILQETLGIERVNVLEDFFDLGGDSLKAVTVVGLINRAFGIEFPLTEILAGASVRAMAAGVSSARQGEYGEIRAVEKRAYYALSSAQKRLFFLDRFETVGTSYNMPGALKIVGKPDHRRLEEVFRQLIARHDSLRTSFHDLGGEPVQRVHERVDFNMEYADNIESFVRPFDLSRAPLFRVGLVPLSPPEHLLLLDIHHIAADGTSVGILAREFGRLYGGESLPPPGIRYRDFSHWQNKLLESGRIKEQEDYWLDLLADVREIPRLNLPFDYPRPPIFSFVGQRHGFALTAPETAAFRHLGEGSGTLYMNLLAVFNVLLYRYTGQEDVIVGSGVAGRRHASLQHLVGLFVNMLAMRHHPAGDKTYPEFLKEVRAASAAALANQDVQLESLIDRLNLEREPSRHPLFDVSFALQNFELPALEAGDLTISPHEFENPTSKFDITLFAFEQDDILTFQLEYCSRLFKADTIRRLAGHFVNIIRQLNVDPHVRLGDIDLLTVEERGQLLYHVNDTAADYPRHKTLHRLFEDQVERTPHHIAVVSAGEHHVSYRQLERRANQLAHYLEVEGNIRTDDRVGIWMDMDSQLAVAILGTLKAGAAYVPIDPAYPLARKKTIIDDARIAVVISQGRYIKWLNRLQWACASFSTFLCLDSRDIYGEKEAEQSELMDERLWRYVAETATDEISGGGWTSSYTGEPLSRAEMAEYGDNILKKLEPLLHRDMRVLEIGCASGISMFRLAPRVGYYHGTDLSALIIDKNRQRVEQEGHENIRLSCRLAHEIDRLGEGDFDLVIINSVIQCFHGHNYLRSVMGKSVSLLKERGHIFIGDVMNQDTREALIADLTAFKRTHRQQNYKTKTDFSEELFVSPLFFEDLMIEDPRIYRVRITDKIHTIENELTKFRYDVLLGVDKTRETPRHKGAKHRYQHDLAVVEQYPVNRGTAGVRPANLAYMIYTSGSTGTPKGVLIEHRGAVNTLTFRGQAYEMGPSMRCLQLFAYSFDGFVTSFFTPLTAGSPLILLNRQALKDAARIGEVIRKCRVNHFICVPALYRVILEHLSPPGAASLRVVTLAGERLTPEILELSRRKNRHLEIVNEYGITETSVLSTLYRHQEQDEEIKIGRPLENTRVYILGPDRRLQPPGVPGELYIGGDGLARGYLNDPELTAERFINTAAKGREETRSSPHQILTPKSQPLYRTGDLCRFLPDGHIAYLGRIDLQVKIRGFRIETAEIESRLMQHQAVGKAAVVMRQDEKAEPYLCAYVVPPPSSIPSSPPLEVTELRDYLHRCLPDYMIPAFFVRLAALPLTPTGKLDRRSLPDPGLRPRAHHAPPRNGVEKKLAAIWSEVLGIGEGMIGRDADFFELGGHSLRATMVISKIHKEWGVQLPLEEIFKTPTIRGLSPNLFGPREETFAAIEAGEKKQYYPLSSAQKRLYILNRLDRQSTGYNMPVAVLLEGELERPKLASTFARLIRRHESLRTSFVEVAGEPVQRVHEGVDFEIEYYDIAAKGAKGREVTEIPVEALMGRFIRPFELSQAPLLRVGLSHPSQEGMYMLMVDMHHIVSDGISMALFIEEFMALYGGAELPPLRLQYRDYVAWQRRREPARAEELNRQRRFWLEEFYGDIPGLTLPLDHPRPPQQSFEGRTAAFDLDPQQVRAMRAYARGQDSTLYILLLSLFVVLLSRLSGQEDIVVGSPASGRRHADLERIVGMFVNTLAQRSRPLGQMPFGEFFRRMTARTLQVFENQDFQFEELVESVFKDRDVSRNPLFDVMFVLQNQDIVEIEIPGLTLTPLKFDPGVTKFDLTLQAVETAEDVSFTLEYSTRLFRADTIGRFIRYFRTMAAAVLTDSHQKLEDIDILSAEEKSRLLIEFNRTAARFPQDRTIHGLFEDRAAQIPHRTALVGPTPGNPHLTYRELDRRAHRLARLLHTGGVRKGGVVAVRLERSPDMMVGIWGILKAGGVYLPIDPACPDERLRFMLDDSGAGILLTPGYLENSRPQGGHREPRPVTAADPAYVIYTSGSTGRPKGVMINHRSLVNRLNWMQRKYPLTGTDTLLQKTPYTFDVSVWELFWWVLAGARLCLLVPGGEKDPAILADAILKSRVTTIHFVPSMLHTFLEYVQGLADLPPFSCLKQVVASGEALFPSLVCRFNQLFAGQTIGLANLYGPTEATIDVSYFDCPPGEHIEKIPIGQPIDNINLLVLGSGGRPQPVGVAGELCISGVGLARGYLNNPELTAEKFVNVAAKGREGTRSSPHQILTPKSQPLYRTGDLCRFLPDGHIEFLGRLDTQVKIRGFRIEPGEIEAGLLTHPAVQEAVVLARERGNGEKLLVAYIIPTPPNPTNPTSPTSPTSITNSLRNHLSQQLPDYMIPAFFVPLERMPLTAHGKVDRNRLPQPTWAAVDDRGPTAPYNQWQARLRTIWADVLSVAEEMIGIDTNFFALGGHSLKANILVYRIRSEWGVELSLGQVFKSPFIRDLAAIVQAAGQQVLARIEPLSRREYYPQSSAQKRLFFLDRFGDGGTAYHMPFVFDVRGQLDRKRFEDTFRRLMARHEALRTSFTFVDDAPVQVVLERLAAVIEYYEAEEFGDEIIENFMRPFDLGRAPLWRVGLARTDTPRPSQEGRYVLLVDMHHIIADGISTAILVRDFAALYAGRPLPPLRIQYRDFCRWQNSSFHSSRMKAQESYWLALFSGDIPVLHLPADYPRPVKKSYAGGQISFALTAAEAGALRHLARQQDMTLFMLLLAVYNVWLARLSGQEDIVVGTPIAGRRHADLEPIIGMFANTLALRNFPCRDRVFREFLGEIKVRLLAAYENQDFQFEELVERLPLARDTGRHPLFDVMFALQEVETSRAEIPGLTISPLDYHNRTAKFDLTLRVTDGGETLSFTFEYSTALFKGETVARLATYFHRLVSAVIADQGQKIGDIEIIPEAERRELLFRFNDTTAAFPRDKTLPHLFERQAAAAPHHLALFFHDRQVTYGELETRSAQWARLLRLKGVEEDTIVGLKLERSLELIAAMLAVLRAGGAYLPLDPDCPRERLRFMLQDSGARLVLTAQSLSRLSRLSEGEHEFRQSMPSTRQRPMNLAYVIYTSGSTGRPKGVLVEHGSAVNVVTWFARHYQLDGDTRLVQLTDYTFDASVNQIFGSLLHGAVLGVVEKALTVDTERLYLYMARHRVHMVNFVPFLLKELLLGRERLPDLRTVISGGEKLDDTLRQQIGAAGYRLFNHYGPTEATIDALAADCSEGDDTLGRPIANARCYILDRSARLLPMGVRGEIYIGGHGLARGYLNNPGLTAEKFVNVAAKAREDTRSSKDEILTPKSYILYRTGDLGRWLPTGRLEFMGRLDHQVKLRGYRIELGEIESKLQKHPAVQEVAAAVRQGENGDHCLCAYIVSRSPRPSASALSSELRDYLSRELPGYMIPACFVPLEKMPLSATGKVDRRALPAPRAAAAGERRPAANRLEEELVNIWSVVLNIDRERIGVDDNFFRLGGHSLKATLLTARLHRALNVRVPLEAIFRKPSIRELSEFIQQTAEPAAAERFIPIPPVERREYYEVSHSQRRVWVMSQFDGGSLTFNMPGAYRLEGRLDRAALARVFAALIRRHESLRTVFITINGEPRQRVRPVEECGFRLEQTDVRDSGAADREVKIGEWLRDDADTPFDLAAGPLLRARLIRLEAAQYVLLFTIHHIVSDALSMEVLVREVIGLYEGYIDGGPGPAGDSLLPQPLKIHYKDFTAWQNQLLEDGQANAHREYWLRHLQDPLSPLELPLDRPRPDTVTYEGDTVEIHVAASAAAELRQLCLHSSASLFMGLLAALDILFYRLTGQTDIVLGTAIAGRQHVDLEGQIGFYLNTLALRTRLSPGASFRDVLEQVKEVTTAAYEHQAYPFDKLVEELGRQRESNRHPLFDVMVDMIQATKGQRVLSRLPLQITPYGRPLRKSKFDLTVYVFEAPDHLKVEFDYNTDLFERETISYMADSFRTLLDSVLKNPLEDISDLVMDEGLDALSLPPITRHGG
jgi:amino acid adenylation domain-containing protein